MNVVLLLLVATTAWAALSTSMMLARGGTMGLVLDLLGRDEGVVPTVVLVGLLGTLLSLAAAFGTRLRVRALGSDAQSAVAALGQILEQPLEGDGG